MKTLLRSGLFALALVGSFSALKGITPTKGVNIPGVPRPTTPQMPTCYPCLK